VVLEFCGAWLVASPTLAAAQQQRLVGTVERVIGRSTGGCRLLAGQSVVFVDSLRHAASLMVWSARMGIEAT
jgi:hypothetical protein